MSEKKNRANIHMLGAIGFVAVATPGLRWGRRGRGGRIADEPHDGRRWRG